jgi:ribosomal protein S18 acetylase RimI-like enzyme
MTVVPEEGDMGIQIAELSKDEREQWESLYRAYADFYRVPMDKEALDTVWSWIQDPANEFYSLVAKDDSGNLVGLMHYRAMPSPLRGKFIGFLDDLYVKPEWRGQGVVDRLFDALNNEAVKYGWPLVRWITADDNYRARGYYDKVSDKTQWVTYQMNVRKAGNVSQAA